MKQIAKTLGFLMAAALVMQTVSSAQALTLGELKETLSDRMRGLKENRENLQEVRQEKNLERQEERNSDKKELGTKSLETAEVRLANMIERVTARFNKHDVMLSNWLDRAKARNSARATKTPNAKYTEQVDQAFAKATTSLTQARTSKDAALKLLNALTAEDWKTQNEKARAAKAAVVVAQVDYAHVLRDFKLALVELKKSVK